MKTSQLHTQNIREHLAMMNLNLPQNDRQTARMRMLESELNCIESQAAMLSEVFRLLGNKPEEKP